jgi:hypothetical protein
MKQEPAEREKIIDVDRVALVREIAGLTRIVVEPARVVDVAKLSAATLETVRVEFEAEAFDRQPADFVVVLRSSSDE